MSSSSTPSVPWFLQSGAVLAGKYQLEHELGRGAMGAVWAATHLSLGQHVAVKFIHREHAQSAELRQRFSTEAKAVARLRSQYIVRVHDDGETQDGLPYLVMERLEGQTLERRLELKGPLPLDEVVLITVQVARGLARAHGADIVHRDLKPANIFLTRSEDPELKWVSKVVDFGIAKVDRKGSASTAVGALLGTPLYMAPEQVQRASQVDHRADLYSLGMVTYTMLTGREAYAGDTFNELLVAICTQPLPDLTLVAPDLPPPLNAWFQKACARDPNRRFQSAEELSDALRSAATAAGLSLSALSGSGPHPSDPALDETLASVGAAASNTRVESPAVSTSITAHATRPQRGLRWALAAAVLGLGLFGLVAARAWLQPASKVEASAQNLPTEPAPPSDRLEAETVRSPATSTLPAGAAPTASSTPDMTAPSSSAPAELPESPSKRGPRAGTSLTNRDRANAAPRAETPRAAPNPETPAPPDKPAPASSVPDVGF